MKTRTRAGRASAAKSGRAGVATHSAGTATCAGGRVSTSSGAASPGTPSLFEAAWLSEHAAVYANPEADIEATLRVARLAVAAGYPHPMASEFAWPRS